MLAWCVSRVAGGVARICGASAETANGVRMVVAAASVPFDPIGGGIGIAHAAAAEGARNGHEGAKVVDFGLRTASWLTPLPGIEFPGPESTDI
jgi:hypothetical protein